MCSKPQLFAYKLPSWGPWVCKAQATCFEASFALCHAHACFFSTVRFTDQPSGARIKYTIDFSAGINRTIRTSRTIRPSPRSKASSAQGLSWWLETNHVNPFIPAVWKAIRGSRIHGNFVIFEFKLKLGFCKKGHQQIWATQPVNWYMRIIQCNIKAVIMHWFYD